MQILDLHPKYFKLSFMKVIIKKMHMVSMF